MRHNRTGRVAVAVLLTLLAVVALTAAPVPAAELDGLLDGNPPVRVKVQETGTMSHLSCSAYASEVDWDPIRIWAEGHVSCNAPVEQITVTVELYQLTSWITSEQETAYETNFVKDRVTHGNCFPGVYQAKVKGYAKGRAGYTPNIQHPQADGALTIVTCR